MKRGAKAMLLLAAPAEDQRVDIEGGKISRVQSAKLKSAFLVVIAGNPAQVIDEIETVQAVFKDGQR